MDDLPSPKDIWAAWHTQHIHGEASKFKEECRKDLIKQGMGKGKANEQAWREALRLYPIDEDVPIEDKPIEDAPGDSTLGDQASTDDTLGDTIVPVSADPDPAPASSSRAIDEVSGLGDIPAEWPELPSNASLQADLSWVQSERLRVVRGDRVDLSRASVPAPSMSALAWLETSVRSYAKYVEVVARTLRDEEVELEHVRRERMAIAEIRELLAEMLPENEPDPRP